MKTSKDLSPLNKEVKCVKDIPRKFQLLIYYIEAVIRKTLNNIFIRIEQYYNASKNIITVKLPYLGSLSHSLSRNLLQPIKDNYKSVEIKPVFTITNTISGLWGGLKIESPSPSVYRLCIILQ